MDMNVVEKQNTENIPTEFDVSTQLTTACENQTTDDEVKECSDNCENSRETPDDCVEIEKMLVVTRPTQNDGCSDGKCLCLDCGRSTDGHRFSQSLHKMFVLEALQKLRGSVRKHICRLDEIRMPKKDKIYLRMKFTANLIKVDEFMMEITRTYNLPCTLQFYINMFQLEAQFSKNLQRFNDVLTCLIVNDVQENQGILNQFFNHFNVLYSQLQVLLFD